ncbi:hypothetical protein GCM10010172_82180 [Paractinoplanes ferrugineus]|uniref:Uncharacterized protein n=1 Tax=Paractinoplanes ferrugineus TaxID=113564 RepID=A0A919J160_9ACTN|nr:hypothetical protein [Actinoplanes ferrugineus]GIE10539.1 hypothetical protein Afe05nite_23790 [Actinoplanes ferrugineus]
MLTAERTGLLRGRYQLSADGQPVAVWDPSWWRTGGDFDVQGRRYQVRANGWGTKYRMLDETGGEVALVERAGRKHWTVRAGGRTFEFRRASIWGNQQDLLADGVRVGSLRRTSAWSGAIEADLPGMPLPVQICVVGVQIAIWQAQQSAAAAGS